MNQTTYLKYIADHYPNTYRRHYLQHAETDYRLRKYKVRVELYRLRQLEAERNPRALEKLADYLLAEDHAAGLMLRREATGQLADCEEYPALGHGARQFLDLSDKVKQRNQERIKKCEGCECEYVDWSLRNNSRVCSEKCRRRKDAVRQRKGGQIKRERERQQYEYPFYSPQEMYMLENRSERAANETTIEMRNYATSAEYDEFRLNGRRKPRIDPDESAKYKPAGRDAREEPVNGPVIVRRIGEIEGEEQFGSADGIGQKWRNGGFLTRRDALNSEKPNT